MSWLAGLIPQYGGANALFGRGLVAVAVVWSVIGVLRWQREGLRTALAKSVPEALVAVSLAGIWAFTVAPLATFLPGDVPQHMPVNLVPVLPLLSGLTTAEGWRENAPNLVGNMLLYSPLGFGVSWRLGIRLWQVALIAACLSGAVEVSQALSDQMRTPDVNDVLLNSTGAVIAASAYRVANAAVRSAPVRRMLASLGQVEVDSARSR